jgi:hypothetical protein
VFCMTKRSIVALFVVILLPTGASLSGAQGSHRACTPQPDCHRTVRIAACCCCDDGDASNQPGIAPARIAVTADQLSAIAIVPYTTMEPPQSCATSWHIDTSQPHERASDLPILLADLRL